MTKMAAMPIYGKNLTKSSSPQPKGRWHWNFVCSIGCSSAIKFVQMMTLGLLWHIVRQGQIWSLMLYAFVPERLSAPAPGLYTLNETYNRLPYILAAGSGNKTWWSKVLSCIHKEAPCPNSSSYFISIDANVLHRRSPDKGTLVSKSHIFCYSINHFK